VIHIKCTLCLIDWLILLEFKRPFKVYWATSKLWKMAMLITNWWEFMKHVTQDVSISSSSLSECGCYKLIIALEVYFILEFCSQCLYLLLNSVVWTVRRVSSVCLFWSHWHSVDALLSVQYTSQVQSYLRCLITLVWIINFL